MARLQSGYVPASSLDPVMATLADIFQLATPQRAEIYGLVLPEDMCRVVIVDGTLYVTPRVLVIYNTDGRVVIGTSMNAMDVMDAYNDDECSLLPANGKLPPPQLSCYIADPDPLLIPGTSYTSLDEGGSLTLVRVVYPHWDRSYERLLHEIQPSAPPQRPIEPGYTLAEEWPRVARTNLPTVPHYIAGPTREPYRSREEHLAQYIEREVGRRVY
jgi:hypothetical protein